MPIKFRCKYCQQFLGISRSRAGAVVDCPQCARSVRVPELDGRTRKMPGEPKAGNDPSLISALSELSSLDDDSVDSLQTPPAETDFESLSDGMFEPIDLQYLEKPVSVDRDLPVSVQADTVEALKEPLYSKSPVALSESLSELASLDGDLESQPISAELLQEMRQISGNHRWLSMPALLLSLITLIGGLAGGWWIAESDLINLDRFKVGSTDPESAKTNQPVTSSGLVRKNAEEQDSPTADVVVQGTVEYQAPSGHMLPDEGALILLLPNERSGTLLLDARSLNQASAHPDFRATKAALNSLSGTIVRTDGEGLFAVSYNPEIVCTIIVASKHSQRADYVPLRPDVERILKTWFRSPNHLCGRLGVQIAEAKNSSTLNFQFHGQQ